MTTGIERASTRASRIRGRRRDAAIAAIKTMLQLDFANSNERWLVDKCVHCDAITLVAAKYGFDEWDDVVVPGLEIRKQRGGEEWQT